MTGGAQALPVITGVTTRAQIGIIQVGAWIFPAVLLQHDVSDCSTGDGKCVY